MTDSEIKTLGVHAETILGHNSFLALWDVIVAEVGRDILRSGLEGKDERESLFLTYHGMRAFFEKMRTYRAAADNVRLMESQRDDASIEDVEDTD